jgi:hypothetical protein
MLLKMEAALTAFLGFRLRPFRQFSQYLHGLMILCIFFMLPATSALASQIVLDEVKIKPTALGTTIDIAFGIPLVYQKHFPQKYGEIVQIQLRLDDDGTREIHKEVREGGELLTAEGKSSVLVYITYEEGVPGGPYLTLRFAHPVKFDVIPGPDGTSLSVKVYDDKLNPAASGKAGVAKEGKKEAEAKKADLMMAKARQAITFGNNKGAIEILRKILRLPDNVHTQEAYELLGLALERDKQIPRAKYEYKKYLKRYPEGEGSVRVRQRLAALRDLRVKAKRKLRRSARGRRPSQLITFGRFTQAYSEYYLDRDLTPEEEAVEETLLQRLLTSHLSVKSRYRSEERTVQAIFNASQTHDFLAGDPGREDDKENESDVRRLYIDVDDHKYGYSGRLGRQSSRNGGVFGTFDGAIVGYQVAPKWVVSAMAGKPVIRVYNDIDIYKKFFYGVKADVVSADKRFGSNLFLVNQTVDGITDRQAAGGDIRYARKGLSIFGLLDYDILYSELSLFNVRIGWNYTKSNKFNFSYNRRNLVMTSRAVDGMSVTTIDALRDYLSESEIRRIAEERTRLDETLTIGNTYQINKNRQLNVDVTMLQSSAVPEGIDPVKQQLQLTDPTVDPTVYGYDATSMQYIYSMQLISSSTFIARDLYVLGLRRSEFDTYTDTSAYINARVPLFEKWRPGFRLNLSNRDSQSYGKSTTISPSLKINYRLSKTWSFDGDLGLDFVDNTTQPDEVRKRIRLAYNVTF